MKTRPKFTGAVLAGFVAVALSAVCALAVERPGFETYVVKSGDTLAKIAGRVFGDPKRWRELLKENPQIANANRIFPGDAILVPVPLTPATAEVTSEKLAARAVEDLAAQAAPVEEKPAVESAVQPPPPPPVVVPELPVEPARPPAVVSPAVYRSAGYIADNLPAIAIIGAPDGKIMLGSGDAAIINAPVLAGKSFTVVRASGRVFQPQTGEYLGWVTRILGTADVTCRGERTSTVMLKDLTDAPTVGDYLVPLEAEVQLPDDVLARKVQPECIAPGPGEGVVVALNEENRLSAIEQDLVYIDRGTKSGVAPGQRFTVYREIAPEGRVTVGAIQVLRATERTATALVTTSVSEILVGDLLRAR